MSLLIIRHALRDMRASLRHMRLFFVVLMLGVAVMGAIGSLVSSLKAGIDRDARALLGGDIEIRQLYNPLPLGAEAFIAFNSEKISHSLDMRAMAEGLNRRALVEMKGVDIFYPLYGEMTYAQKLTPQQRRDAFRKARGKLPVHAASVDQSLLDMLDIKLGDAFTIGKARFIATHIIRTEPDRAFSAFSLGPRVLLTRRGFHATGLMQPGSMVNHRYRILLPEGQTPAAWKEAMHKQFPDARWNVRDWNESAPGLVSMIDRLSLFFALTSITALMVAGIGIANATGVYMWSKRQTIAALKCLGASQRHIFGMYMLQILIVSAVAILAGCGAAALIHAALLAGLGDALPIRAQEGLYLKPLLLSAALGFLTVLLFTLMPLARTADIKPRALMRGHVERWSLDSWRRPLFISASLLLAALLVGLTVLFTNNIKITVYFAAGLAISMLLLFWLGNGIQRYARRAAHSGAVRLNLSMALANLARPGASTNGMVVALGIGISLMVTLALVGGNLRAQIEQGLPENAPAFFLADIQPSQLAPLQDALRAVPGVYDITHLPMVRGRIIKLNGQPPEQLQIADSARWGVRGERGLTTADAMPENTSIIQGSWWPKDYKGPPLVSFDANLARGMGLTLGDTITIAALDKQITATIASLRDIQWGSLEMNFAIVLSPGALEGLPATYLATVSAPPSTEKAIQQLLADHYPSVAIVRVREVLSRVSGILNNVSNAVMATALITVLASILVMAGAIHASMHKRIFDTVMLKVLGADKSRMMKIYLMEFVIIALAVALIAILIGSAGAWGIMQLMVFSQFTPMPGVIGVTIAASLLLAILLGLVATRGALAVRPLSLLRNE